MTCEKIIIGKGTEFPLNGTVTFPDDLTAPVPALVMVHGSGFCQEFGQSHFRSILLPPMETLEEAYGILEKFMLRHQ